MTRSKPFSRNLVNPVLNSLIIALFLCGCSMSTKPTYSALKIEQDAKDIALKEYGLSVTARLVGETFWYYLPVESLFKKAEKPQKIKEKFLIEENKNEFVSDSLKVNYVVLAIPEKEKLQEVVIDEKALKDLRNSLEVMQRLIFSSDAKERDKIKFYCLVISDINTGYELRELFYYKDILKLAYRLISSEEYHRRMALNMFLNPDAIGDKEGKHMQYINLTMKDFVSEQIKHRIGIRFQRPEAEQNIDIDKEIKDIVIYTLKTYGIDDLNSVELVNLHNDKTVIVNKPEISGRTSR